MNGHVIEEWKEQSIEEFLSGRAGFMGGSDLPDMLGVGDYGCKRRFFLGKLGLLPDRDSHHLERGRFLEGPVAELYAARTGRKVEKTGGAYADDLPFLKAHADRLVWRSPHQMGVLEIKCPAQATFKKIQRTGLPEAWIVQLQAQMRCYGASWGSFAVYWADGHELEWFDVEADSKLQQLATSAADGAWKVLAFMKTIPLKDVLIQLPPVLDEHSKACANCPAFSECHVGRVKGDKISERHEMEAFVAEFQAGKEELKQLESRQDELKGAIKDAFDAQVGTVRAGRFTVSITECRREGFDAAQAKRDLGERAQKYVKFSTYDRLLVKEAK